MRRMPIAVTSVVPEARGITAARGPRSWPPRSAGPSTGRALGDLAVMAMPDRGNKHLPLSLVRAYH